MATLLTGSEKREILYQFEGPPIADPRKHLNQLRRESIRVLGRTDTPSNVA